MPLDTRLARVKTFLRRVLPAPMVHVVRSRRDQYACAAFLLDRRVDLSIAEKVRLLNQFYVISSHVVSYHTQAEAIAYVRAILCLPAPGPGVIVEAGCFKGGSTAKLSLAAEIAGRKLVVFDSFQGIPDHAEPHTRSIFGQPVQFARGEYGASLPEVMENVSAFGSVRACQFVAGWFRDTLPQFREPVSMIVLDVDLASSTRECVKHLYPRLETNGVLFSHDGHLPLVLDVFTDTEFWRNDVGCEKPDIPGLGRKKLLKIIKRCP